MSGYRVSLCRSCAWFHLLISAERRAAPGYRTETTLRRGGITDTVENGCETLRRPRRTRNATQTRSVGIEPWGRTGRKEKRQTCWRSGTGGCNTSAQHDEGEGAGELLIHWYTTVDLMRGRWARFGSNCVAEWKHTIMSNLLKKRLVLQINILFFKEFNYRLWNIKMIITLSSHFNVKLM